MMHPWSALHRCIKRRLKYAMSNFLELNNVTLLTVTSVDLDAAANALLISSEYCKFGSIKMLSPTRPISLHKAIEHIAIPPIDFIGYSKFMIEDLHKFVDTEFCLCIQSDGFVINPSLWTNEFLEYDYLGAPWPNSVNINSGVANKFYFDKNKVGNGGFSLRSKKLLEICSQIKFDELNFLTKSEDMIICHFLYEEMLKAGIKFAPLKLASKFSIEWLIENENSNLASSFGFHGKHWLSDDYLQKLAAQSNYPKEFSSLLKKHLSIQPLNRLGRVGRLEQCPCGSAKRYKDCHGKLI
jgi:hypothetical protein